MQAVQLRVTDVNMLSLYALIYPDTMLRVLFPSGEMIERRN